MIASDDRVDSGVWFGEARVRQLAGSRHQQAVRGLDHRALRGADREAHHRPAQHEPAGSRSVTPRGRDDGRRRCAFCRRSRAASQARSVARRPFDGGAADGDIVTRVAAAHGRGLAVRVFPVNRAWEYDLMVRLGIDGIFTDVPDQALAWGALAPALV